MESQVSCLTISETKKLLDGCAIKCLLALFTKVEVVGILGDVLGNRLLWFVLIFDTRFVFSYMFN